MTIVWEDESLSEVFDPAIQDNPQEDYTAFRTEIQREADQMPWYDKMAIGAGREVTGLADGILDLLPESLGGYNDAQRQVVENEQALYEAGMGDQGWATVGRGLPYLAVPAVGGRGYGAMAGEAGLGGLLEYLQYKPTQQERLTDASVAGAFGGVLRRGMDYLGNKVDARGTRDAEVLGKRNERNELEALSEAWGVPLSMGDTSSSPWLRGAEVNAEKAPFVGLGAFREKQGKAAEQAAGQLADTYGGPGAGQTMKQSLIDQKKNMKAESRSLYDEVKAQVDPDAIVPTTNTQQFALDEALKLEGINPIHVPSDLRDMYDQWMENPNMNYDQLRTRLSQLRRDIRGMNKNPEMANEARILEQIVGKIDNDLTAFTNSQGPLATEAAKRANTHYREEFAPLYRPQKGEVAGQAIASAMRTDDPDAVFKKLFEGKSPAFIEKTWKAMDPAGKDAVRETIIQRAVDAGAPTGSQKKVFSLNSFATSLEKDLNALRKAFNPDEVAEIEGLIKLMRAAERGGQYLENPPTGQRLLVGGAMGLGDLFSTGGALSGTTAAFKLLTTTPTGKKILRGLGHGSHSVNDTTKKVMDFVNQATGGQGPNRLGTAVTQQVDTMYGEQPRLEIE